MSGLFKPPAPPPIQPPPPMPDTNSPQVMEAQRSAVAQQMAAGRASTILTKPGGTLAGGDYGSQKLGAR